MKVFIISILFIVNGILGFLCQVLYANYFGSGKEMDIYFSLISIPAIITGATGTIFSSLFFPAFAQKDYSQLDAYIYKVKSYVTRTALLVTSIGFAITCYNLTCIIDTEELYYYDLAFLLCGLFWLNAFLSIVNGYLASVQNYFKNFLIVSFTQLLVYISIILFVTLFHDCMGVRSIASGLVFASIVSFFVNRYYGSVFHKSEIEVRVDVPSLMFNICLIIISFLPFHAFASISYLWAGQLEYEGSVSTLGYSHSFCGFLSTAVSMGIVTVSFPDLAKSLSSTDKSILKNGYLNYRNQLVVVIEFASYIVAFVSLFAHPIIELLFMRGHFDLNAVDALASILPIYLIDGILIAIMNITRNVYFSLNKQKALAFISGTVTLLFFICSIVLSRSVNYFVIGITETICMGLFVLVSLYYINSFCQIFSYKFVLKTLGQLTLFPIVGWLMLLLFEFLSSYNLNIIVLIVICGFIYSFFIDVIFVYLLKNSTMISINKKVIGYIKRG